MIMTIGEKEDNTDKLTDYNNPIVKLYTEREEK